MVHKVTKKAVLCSTEPMIVKNEGMTQAVKEVDNMIEGTAMEVVENKVKVLVDKITKTISSAEGKMLAGEVVFVEMFVNMQ